MISGFSCGSSHSDGPNCSEWLIQKVVFLTNAVESHCTFTLATAATLDLSDDIKLFYNVKHFAIMPSIFLYDGCKELYSAL